MVAVDKMCTEEKAKKRIKKPSEKKEESWPPIKEYIYKGKVQKPNR